MSSSNSTRSCERERVEKGMEGEQVAFVRPAIVAEPRHADKRQPYKESFRPSRSHERKRLGENFAHCARHGDERRPYNDLPALVMFVHRGSSQIAL